MNPRILAFDTSSARGSVALLEGRDLCAEIRLHSLQTHSNHLLASIEFLLGRLKWSLQDLELIAVGNGPGSFTGIRIGVSTAMGLARSLSVPFAEISGLDALAHEVPIHSGRIGVVLNAHRSQAYYAEYLVQRSRIRSDKKPGLIEISALEHHLQDRHLYLVGDLDACGLKKAEIESSNWPRPVHADLFLAKGIGRLALERRRRWRTGDSVISEPTYIRPPDALKKKKR